MLKPLLLVLALACGTGCTTGYWTDRGHDVADVFTATIGVGLGKRARVGPLRWGILGMGEAVGLKNGLFVTPRTTAPGEFPSVLTVSSPEPAYGHPVKGGGWDFDGFVFPLRVLPDPGLGLIFSLDKYPVRGNPLPTEEGDPGNLFGDMAYGPFPLVCYPVKSDKIPARRARYKYYTQIEISGGFILSGKLGVNPGEIVDLILGFVGVDIYDDDFERWKRERSGRL